MKRIICLFSVTLFGLGLFGQSKIFGPKGGLTVGIQSWDRVQRQPLFSYHGSFFVESYKEESPSAIFGQIGIHNRGSSERIFFTNQGGTTATRVSESFRFQNVAAIFGLKQRLDADAKKVPYYSIGARVEYTMSTNLEGNEIYAGYFPVDAFVNKFNYGASFAFGYEFPFSEFVGGLIEASVHPDFSLQYEQLGNIPVLNPFTGQTANFRQQSIRNITFEVTFGFRFLHKVIYIDDY